ncbi:Glycine rich protein [Sphingobacterium spiritivorum]|uniref:receptor protein-tyrosine kinase n=1 Tax=Sphingobacterium spiritivorum TaxID=258 RepID=A0A380BI10_SPHSI|nr:glycine-rich protein [Sphingobacterium spiritivorum]SUJ00987.1 Glycine rich protein [Sphingobacterium spiritivorum]
MKKYLLLWLLLIIVRTSFAQCPPMNQPQNIQVCNGTITSPVNFTSNAANVVYTWANSNPAIGLAASGRGNIPAFTAVNTGLSGVTATITVTPKLETSQTYSYTGAMQTFVVPAGVTSIRVDVKGAQGGSAIYNQGSAKPDDLGGKGGRVTAEYPVTPGQTIYVFVGGNNGYNGGGNGGGSIEQPKGGDASDIRIGGTALSNRVIVAGGGGGGGNNCSINAEPGGAGGGLIGETGFQCGDQSGISVGQGGTQSAGGIAGTSSLSNGNSIPATAGQLGLGGNAGIFYGTAAGGGGGGYFGGGGATYGGGGGGSSYTDPQATSVVHTQGFHSGLGQVIITYDTPCASPATKTFTYTVNPTPTMVQPADQSVFAGTNTIAVNFSSPSTGGYISYDWTNNTPAIGLAASGTGNIPAFVTVNASNAPVTATIMVTPKLISGLLDINQTVAPYCAASFAQPNLVQSFKPVANTITGAGVSFQSGGNGSVTISLWDKLPNAGGVQLASGTTTSSPNPWVDVYWAPVSVTPGNTYYLVFSGTNMSQCLAGSSLNPYPDGQVYANNDYQSYPNVDFAFRTYSPGLTTCAGSSQQFQVTVKVLKPDANGILYVKKGSNGLGDSWANAVAELADALVMAKNLNAATPGKVKQIWVAGGIYKPMYNPADNAFGTSAGRNNAFLLVKDVKVYGGFAGSETALAQRDLSAADNKAILSGDFTGNDAVAGFGSTLNITGNAENAYQVVIAAGDAGTAVLDGFTISGGYANGGNLPQINQQQFLVSNWGAGMYVANSSGLAISHIEFVGNKATTGAAMAISGNVDAPKIEEVTFTRNHATQSGGALYSTQNSTIVKSVFIGNKSDDLAGAIAKLGGSVFFCGSLFLCR